MRVATITFYDSAAYLIRIGLLPGKLEFVEIRPKLVTIASIQQAVCEHYKLPLRVMSSSRRAKEESRPRQLAMALCRELTPRSLPEIGQRFGNRDHTTVIHGIRQIAKLRLEDAELDHAYRMIEKKLAP